MGKIKHYISIVIDVCRDLFIGRNTEKQLMQKEYEVIMSEVKTAKTLAELFKARATIIRYDRAVKSMGSPLWGKNNVKFLDANWQRRYRIWKQLRGYYDKAKN